MKKAGKALLATLMAAMMSTTALGLAACKGKGDEGEGDGGGEATSHVVTFHVNGGVWSDSTTADKTETTDADGKVEFPANPTREDYTFSGWYTAATDGTKVEPTHVFTADADLYAHWTEVPPQGGDTTYTITLNANGGTLAGGITSVTTGTDGKLASMPANPTRDEYTFNGWYTAATGGTKVTTNYVFTDNATIFAQWTQVPPTPQGYTITLNANGGTLVGSNTVTTGTDGKLASMPADPTRKDYTFDGWFTADIGGVKITTSYVFTDNSTIYAQWTYAPETKDTVTVRFDPNGGKFADNSTDVKSLETGTDGKFTEFPTVTHDGYTFAGWYDSAVDGNDYTTDYVFTVDGTMLFAHWNPVTVAPTGIALAETSIVLRYDYDLEEEDEPQETKTISVVFTPANTTDRRFTAISDTPSVATVVANPTDGTITITPVGAGEAYITLIATGGDNVSNMYKVEVVGKNTVVVDFDANGGTFDGGDDVAHVVANSGGRIENWPTTPTREDYEFLGWYKDRDSDDRPALSETLFENGDTVYAHWKKVKFEVTFDPNGGEWTDLQGDAATNARVYKTHTYVSDGETGGKFAALPGAVKEDYELEGWFTEAEGGTQITEDTLFDDDDTVVYAHWKKIKFTITLDAEGGTLAGDATVKTNDQGKLEAVPGAATFKDYTFDGWYTGEIEGELVTTDTVFSDDSVIFAHWSFALSESELTLKIGHLTETLTAITEETVTWSSGTASVATVGASTGLVTAVKNGTSVITATTADGVKGTCTVTVPNEYYIVGDLTATDLPYWSIGITNAKADCTFTQENATTYKLEGVTLKKYDTFKISFTSNGSSWDNIIDGAAVDTASKNAKYASGSSGSNISVDDSGIYTLTLTISGSSKSLNFNKTQDIEEDEEDDAVYYLRGNMVSDSWPGASTPEEAGDYAFTKVNENKYTLTVYLVKDNEFKICVVGKDWKIEFDEDCVNRDYIVSKGQSTATKPLQWTSSKNIGAGMTGWYTFTFNPNGGSKNMLSCTFSTTNPNA